MVSVGQAYFSRVEKDTMQVSRSRPVNLGSSTPPKAARPPTHHSPGVAPRVLLVYLLAIHCWLSASLLQTPAANPVLAQDRRPVKTGPGRDLAELPVLRSAFSNEVKPEFIQTQTLAFEQDASQCFIYAAPSGFEYLAVGDLLPTAQPMQPQVPMKTFALTLTRATKVHGVEVSQGTYAEVQHPLSLVPAPKAGFTNAGMYIPDEKIYRASTPFPGKWVSLERGNDNGRQHIFVRFYPLQYIPTEKKALLVKTATIKVYYSEGVLSPSAPPDPVHRRIESAVGGSPLSEARCLIICPQALAKEASRLNEFHTATEKIPSAVVTTEAIAQAYAPAAEPPFRGYATNDLPGNGVNS